MREQELSTHIAVRELRDSLARTRFEWGMGLDHQETFRALASIVDEGVTRIRWPKKGGSG